MGSPMVYNLLKAGYEVSVYTRTKSKAETVLDAGAQWIDLITDLGVCGYFVHHGRVS